MYVVADTLTHTLDRQLLPALTREEVHEAIFESVGFLVCIGELPSVHLWCGHQVL